MSTEAVRGAIAARLETVTATGPIHRYERYAAREADLKVLYAAAGEPLRGWYVRRTGAARYRYGETDRVRVVTHWRLVALCALDDAAQSEIGFDGMLDAVLDAFRADETLDGATSHLFAGPGESRTGDTWGPQLEDSGPVMFAGVLCHRAQLALTTTHYEEGGQS